eukprot:s293_g30.t1
MHSRRGRKNRELQHCGLQLHSAQVHDFRSSEITAREQPIAHEVAYLDPPAIGKQSMYKKPLVLARSMLDSGLDISRYLPKQWKCRGIQHTWTTTPTRSFFNSLILVNFAVAARL